MSAIYTPAILRLAVAAADFPSLRNADARIERRAPLCGSRITLDLRLGTGGRVSAVGFTLHACAVGQAAAALLAREIDGRTAADLSATAHALNRWLDDPAAPAPDWPDISVLAPVRALPTRRGAALLPFEAAAAAAAAVTDRITPA
jgi:NifU-like protein involved in Fe-S cluster formation